MGRRYPLRPTRERRPGLVVTRIDCGHNDCAPVWPAIVQTLADFLRVNGLL